MRKEKKLSPTAPKKTWGGQWFPQGSLFVATFVTTGQESAPKCPTFLSCKTLWCILKQKLTLEIKSNL